MTRVFCAHTPPGITEACDCGSAFRCPRYPEAARAMRESRVYELKTWPREFEAAADGRKRFEYRRNDRDFRVGDVLLLREWSPLSVDYTGAQMAVRVTFILFGPDHGVPDGFVVMSIDTVDNPYPDRRHPMDIETDSSDRFVSPCAPPTGFDRQAIELLVEECAEVLDLLRRTDLIPAEAIEHGRARKRRQTRQHPEDPTCGTNRTTAADGNTIRKSGGGSTPPAWAAPSTASAAAPAATSRTSDRLRNAWTTWKKRWLP